MISKMVNQYVVTMLWSSTADNLGRPLDHDYSIEDLAPETLQKCVDDCNQFLALAGAITNGLDLEDLGHDFWLTRNGHGAGFWDGDYEKAIGLALTQIAESFSALDAYVGDDGKIYLT